MHFFQKKIERYAQLIEDGKLSLAAAEMKRYLDQGLQEQSDSAHLMQRVQAFDATIKEAIIALEDGDAQDAKRSVAELERLIKEIKLYAALVAKEESTLE